MNEAKSYHNIDTDRGLIERCQHWSECPRLGIDTEFVRTRTYFARLGLVQIFDGEQCYLIDPLAISDLTPLFDVFANQKVLKILHSGSEDLEIFARLAGHAPTPLFDTQLAAALCGLGPSLGYRGLVEALIGDQLAKTEQRSDWLKRPLTTSQMQYAAMDVFHLLDLHSELERRMASLGRADWALEENLRSVRKGEADGDLEEQFRRFKIAWKLSPLGAEILYRLVAWRDQAARSRDIPRSHVVPDEVLLDIAFEQPDSVDAFKQGVRASGRATTRYAQQLVDLVTSTQEISSTSWRAPPPPPLGIEQRQLMQQLRQVVADTSNQLGLAAETLASRRDLVHLIQTGELPERLRGWRQQVVGQALLQVCGF